MPILYLRGLSTGDFQPALKELLREDAAGLPASNISRLLGGRVAGSEARGMRALALVIGDGALGFWAAMRDVWPETREQRDWVHRIVNVLDKLPKRLQAGAKEALREIREAPTRAAAEEEMVRFEAEYGAKYPKAVASLRRDQDKLVAFYDFPAEHWKDIRTTTPIESAFSTGRLRQRVTKGPGSRNRGLMTAYKLLRMARERWRRLDRAELLPLVRAGVPFTDGEQVEREDQQHVERVVA